MLKRTKKIRSNYSMPLPPDDGTYENECCMSFLSQLSHTRQFDTGSRIATAIKRCAGEMDTSTAHVALILVEHGLRAPRSTMPQDFLDHIDERLERSAMALGAPTFSQLELARMWEHTDWKSAPPPKNRTTIRELETIHEMELVVA